MKNFNPKYEELGDYLVFRRLSEKLVPYFQYVHPVFISILGILSAIISCWIFLKYDYRIMAIFLFISVPLFDCLDGDVARFTKSESYIGKIIDSTFDIVFPICLVAVLVVRYDIDILIGVLAVGTIFFQYLLFAVFKHTSSGGIINNVFLKKYIDFNKIAAFQFPAIFFFTPSTYYLIFSIFILTNYDHFFLHFLVYISNPLLMVVMGMAWVQKGKKKLP